MRKAIISLLVFSAAAASVLTGCGSGGGSGGDVPVNLQRDNSDRIAFAVRRERTENGDVNLFTMEPDGTDRLQLTKRLNEPDGWWGSVFRYPVWSTHRSRILYSAKSNGLRIMDASVGALRFRDTPQITQAAVGSSSWSPDMQTICSYAGGSPESWLLPIIAIDSSRWHTVFNPHIVGGMMSTWSPDSRIVVASVAHWNQPVRLWVIRTADFTLLRQLTSPSVAPEVAGEHGDFFHSTFPPALDSTKSYWKPGISMGGDMDPDFSLDGTRVAFARNTGDAATGGIFVVEIETGRETRLTTGLDSSPAFSPDGSRIVFSRTVTGTPERQNELFVIGSDGGSVRQITFTPSEDEIDPDW